VYLAGAVPMRPDGTWVRGSFAEQARAAFTNLARVAEAAGADLTQAVKVGVYLRDFDDFAEMNTIYAEFFATANLPVRTTLPVPLDGFDIEVDAILYTGE
jgi:enamine deaminase RidA (YjgF/YER057c/UK114 family)